MTAKRRDVAVKTLDLAHKRYLGKSGILSEWDRAYRAWLESELTYANLDAERKNAVVELDYATGELKCLLQGSQHTP